MVHHFLYYCVRLASSNETIYVNSDADIYPGYEELSQAKKACYPNAIIFKDDEIITPLQFLLDHITERLFLALNGEKIPENVTFYHKLGFDGSSGHSEHKHIVESESVSDVSVVLTTTVPIRMISESNQSILWQNPAPSSTE